MYIVVEVSVVYNSYNIGSATCDIAKPHSFYGEATQHRIYEIYCLEYMLTVIILG